LVDGKIQINAITVPNPPGFVSSNLFHLANIDITLVPGSVFSPQTVIQKIFINSPTINLEQTETSGNASELKDTLMGFMPPAPEANGAPTPKDSVITGRAGAHPVVRAGRCSANAGRNQFRCPSIPSGRYECTCSVLPEPSDP
jgi:hypothetical protein